MNGTILIIKIGRWHKTNYYALRVVASRRQEARLEGKFPAQPVKDVKVESTFVMLSILLIHQPFGSLGEAQKQ